MRKYALDVQLCVCIDQLAVLHVNQKCKMSQKISTEDGLPNISNDENPRECSSKTEVECEGAFTIRANWSIVYSSEGQRVRSVSISTRGRNDTDFRACIN